ncbi:unnamed protein product [Closterium sp. Yama58-4]|nr:unnamed protein product [Closterium sp. Yama58-4]
MAALRSAAFSLASRNWRLVVVALLLSVSFQRAESHSFIRKDLAEVIAAFEAKAEAARDASSASDGGDGVAHRHHGRKLAHVLTETSFDRYTGSLRLSQRDLRRLQERADAAGVSQIARRSTLQAAEDSLMFPLFSLDTKGPFVTTLILGSPAKQFVVLADLSTSVTWVSCDCLSCPSAANSLDVLGINRTTLETRRSLTAKPVACNSSVCAQSATFSCDVQQPLLKDRPGVCEYNISMGAGNVYSDVVTIPLVNLNLPPGEHDSITSPIYFGCNRVEDPAMEGFGPDGAVGLGAGPFSFASQLHATSLLNASTSPRPNAFSLCLDGPLQEGLLIVGATPDPPSGLVTTPFKVAVNSSRYLLNVTAIRLGGTEVNGTQGIGSMVNSSFGGFSLDTARDFISLRRTVYENLVTAVYATDAVLETGLDSYTGYYCGVVAPGASPSVVFPPIFFDLPEGSFSVPWQNYMYSVANETHEILCLLAESHPDWAPRNVYLGTPFLVDTYWKFDLDKSTVSFMPYNCSALEIAPAPSSAPVAPNPPLTAPTTPSSSPPMPSPTSPTPVTPSGTTPPVATTLSVASPPPPPKPASRIATALPALLLAALLAALLL